jgi:hypothetical protein
MRPYSPLAANPLNVDEAPPPQEMTNGRAHRPVTAIAFRMIIEMGSSLSGRVGISAAEPRDEEQESESRNVLDVHTRGFRVSRAQGKNLARFLRLLDEVGNVAVVVARPHYAPQAKNVVRRFGVRRVGLH